MSLHVLRRAADSPDGKVDSSAVLLAVGYPFWRVISPCLLAKSWLFDVLWLSKCFATNRYWPILMCCCLNHDLALVFSPHFLHFTARNSETRLILVLTQDFICGALLEGESSQGSGISGQKLTNLKVKSSHPIWLELSTVDRMLNQGFLENFTEKFGHTQSPHLW
jgi:hypothetical protein